MISFLNGNALQDAAADTVDTLSGDYSQWEAAAEMEQSGAFIQMMASNDLIFVVLAVSLIIWLVLLFFIIRLDKKVSGLEETLNTHRTDSP